MIFLKILAMFGLLLIALVSQAGGSTFGVCERTVQRRKLNDSVVPPEYYKINETIRECCFGFMTNGKSCIPMCQNVCINSHCIGNNKCKCNSGYFPVDHFRCQAQCDPKCGPNMACLAPDKCVCKPDYKKVESHCEPICSFTADNFECINAKCVAPNECECLEGFRRVSEFQCEPICTNGCSNGDCHEPEICECHQGYDKNSAGVCEPICDPGCINAECVAPNNCQCLDSFAKYLKPNECLERHVINDRESCLRSCQHGTCSDDGLCMCASGFEMYNGKCLKLCDNECHNGKCLEDQCVCPENYRLSENSTACLPICTFEDGHDCISGTCVAPQTCQCFDGYKFLDSRNCTCVPMCDPQCINGICLEGGCVCHENFYNISDYECIKNCTAGTKWVFDECIEYSSFEVFGTEEIEEFFNATTEAVTSFEETSEDESDVFEDDDAVEDDDDDDEGSATSTENSPTQSFGREETLIVRSLVPQLLPKTTCIVFLSIIAILIISILITFCVLFRRISKNNIYYVQEQEKSSNCVYFTKQVGPELESNL